MPPARTIPPAKAVKTERTHEENQERAYIAASRRSDRSLEARVESARRASEIHKRRTGRSLRVTEQDVINEEMYEEEDDDLPLQYRRLTAHLQTGSADFNRRLAAYLTGQVAMRSAFDQAMQPYPPSNGMYPQGSANPFQSPIIPTGMAHSPNAYRAVPYPSPHHAALRQAHGRAYSTIGVPSYTPHTPTEASPHSLDHRRMSTPATVPPHMTTPRGLDTNGVKADADYIRQTQSATFPSAHYPGYATDIAPFTTTLSPEAQQMLGPAMDVNDHFQSMLMHGSENYIQSPYYPWAAYQSGVKGMPVHPSSYAGMSTTLAPAALDNTSEAVSTTGTPCSTTGVKTELTAPSTGLDFNFSQESKMLPLQSMPESGPGNTQTLASGHVTPGEEGFWGHFVDDASWNEEPVST